MRNVKVMGRAVLALAWASSASAANWAPANTVLTGHGGLTVTSGTALVACTLHMNLKSVGGDLATTVNAAGTADAGPTFSDCTDSIIHSPSTTVTASGFWLLTATGTTAADGTHNVVISIGGVCSITATAAVPNHVWSNATHTLTANSASNFDITRHGLCPGTATTATMSGSIVFPASAIVT